MSALFGVVAIVCIVLAAAALAERVRLHRYWRRACTGFAWRRRFPSASNAEIRSFLTLFVNAFAFAEFRRLSFSPDDKPLEVYRALYPVQCLGSSVIQWNSKPSFRVFARRSASIYCRSGEKTFRLGSSMPSPQTPNPSFHTDVLRLAAPAFARG